MIENFGSYIKHERELRGVPLEEISGTTKIHIRFLQALEENKFDELPGEVFIKGYIRSYANTIGSDGEELLNIYEESVGFKPNVNFIVPETKPNISAKNFLGIALIGLFLVALIVLIKFLILDRSLPTPKKLIHSSASYAASKKENILKTKKDLLNGKLEETSLREVSVPEKILEEKKETDILISKPETQKQEQAPDLKGETSSKNLEKSLKLTIKVKNNSWFNLTVDDLREEDFILAAGEEKSYRGNEVFRLTIGNKHGTDVILNGKNLVLPETKKNVVKDFIINSKLMK